MKQLNLMVMSLLLAGMAFTACSNDDDIQVKENVVLDAFHVFSATGNDLGLPWNSVVQKGISAYLLLYAV